MVSGAWVDVRGGNPGCYWLITVDEMLEIRGCIGSIHAFFCHIDPSHSGRRFRITTS